MRSTLDVNDVAQEMKCRVTLRLVIWLMYHSIYANGLVPTQPIK